MLRAALLLWLAHGDETCLLQRAKTESPKEVPPETWFELVETVEHQEEELKELEKRVSRLGQTSIINSTAARHLKTWLFSWV